MIEWKNKEIDRLFEGMRDMGVRLDYVVLKGGEAPITHRSHRIAAIAAMEVIDKRLEDWALEKATENFPADRFFRVHITNKEIEGKKITCTEFWGSDDAFPKPLNGSSQIIPNANGYKTAFFNPPHSLWGNIFEQLTLFNELNALLLSPWGDDNLEIYQWPNDWSNYFDAGKEWWGTFFWTIYNRKKELFIIIGGSSTD